MWSGSVVRTDEYIRKPCAGESLLARHIFVPLSNLTVVVSQAKQPPTAERYPELINLDISKMIVVASDARRSRRSMNESIRVVRHGDAIRTVFAFRLGLVTDVPSH
jgi:hypothetical protein